MSPNAGEAILVVDDFPTLPVRMIRYRRRIKGYYRLGPDGAIAAATGGWRVPASLWRALDRFSGPDHVAAQRLAPLTDAIATAYPGVPFDNAGHGSIVFALIAGTSPAQPIVLLDAIHLQKMAPADYCDASGSDAVQARLLNTAAQAADSIASLIQATNVRFINYSAGHDLDVIRRSWSADCGGAQPSETVLRQKLAAYEPIYKVLFGTPGIVTAQAANVNDGAYNAPYDQLAPAYRNRLRAGYFTSLASGLDAFGRGDIAPLPAWPARADADVFLNTGVLPERPYPFNKTPLLQLDGFGVALEPITLPHSSWVAPLLTARLVNLRYARFPSRNFDDALIADLFDAVTPALCPEQSFGRCAYQDPLLHGQVEAVRLGFRPAQLP